MGEAEVTWLVVWEKAALTELDAIWKAAFDKEGVQNTAMRIDTELTFRPLEAGESRAGNDRVLFKYPLVVWFRVDSQRSRVEVLHIRALGR